MAKVRITELLYGDIMFYLGDEVNEWSPECLSFIDKLARTATRHRRGRGSWYEVEVTEEEVEAVIDEVVNNWIYDYDDRADYMDDPAERRQYREMVRQYRKFAEGGWREQA